MENPEGKGIYKSFACRSWKVYGKLFDKYGESAHKV